MKLFDSHCHLDDPRFAPDREAVLARARAAGVEELLVPAVRASGWDALLALCRDDPGLHPALGLHPMFLEPGDEAALERLPAILRESGAVAIGECGLDYRDHMPDRGLQQRVLRTQIELAQSTGLPLVLHAVRAVEDLIGLLREHSGVRGVVHSWSGSIEQARQLADTGVLIGIGGPVTRPGARRLRRCAAEIPDWQLLLETDAPDQPDHAWHGQRNEPARLPLVLDEVARLRGADPAEVAERTSANARQLFAARSP